MTNETPTLRIGQFTGWNGDRADGIAELLPADVDVLTGDYLAELTMLVLQKNRARGGVGYVRAFLDVLEPHIEEIARRGIKVVTNAGGLDAPGLATAIRELCTKRGVALSVAAVDGDDLTTLLASAPDLPLVNIDTDTPLPDSARERVLTANAYLGAWPITQALASGADIVVCQRVTDASLVVGPAAWHHGWKPDDLDALAGAVAAGHIIECGAQATGGNFSEFADHGPLGLPGMPLADIAADGSAVIGKSPDSGGLVIRDTVLAQLFYEIGGTHYANPDVVVDLTSVTVEDLGGDRVRVSGTRGGPPPAMVKCALTYEGGYRNTMTIGLTGGNVDAKRRWVEEQVHTAIGPAESFDECRWSMVGPADQHGDFEAATAWLIVTVRDSRRELVDRAHFSTPITALATSNIPGLYLTTPPQQARSFGVQWPTLVDKDLAVARLLLQDAEPVEVPWPSNPTPVAAPAERDDEVAPAQVTAGPTTRVPLGTVLGTRSGDKAGTANIGAWARDPRSFDWLLTTLTPARLTELMPELAGLTVTRYAFPNLDGVNFVVTGYLGDGVSACTRVDPQGKGLGEYLASRLVDVPTSLVPASIG
jgi:hypothetical protein